MYQACAFECAHLHTLASAITVRHTGQRSIVYTLDVSCLKCIRLMCSNCIHQVNALSNNTWESTWLPIFSYHNATLFNFVTDVQWAAIAKAVLNKYPEQSEELKSIAAEFMLVHRKFVSFAYLCGWAYFHELAHSSIAAPGIDTKECTVRIMVSCQIIQPPPLPPHPVFNLPPLT